MNDRQRAANFFNHVNQASSLNGASAAQQAMQRWIDGYDCPEDEEDLIDYEVQQLAALLESVRREERSKIVAEVRNLADHQEKGSKNQYWLGNIANYLEGVR